MGNAGGFTLWFYRQMEWRTMNKNQEEHGKHHHQTQEQHIFLPMRSLEEAYYLLKGGNKDQYSDSTNAQNFTVQLKYPGLSYASHRWSVAKLGISSFQATSFREVKVSFYTASSIRSFEPSYLFRIHSITLIFVLLHWSPNLEDTANEVNLNNLFKSQVDISKT